MAKLATAAENASRFVPTSMESEGMGKKWLLKEMMHTEYLCVEHPHVALKFLPGGILQVFGEQKQPIIHRYSISHQVDEDEYYMEVIPNLTDEPGKLKMDIMKNHLTLTNKNGEVLHLNKLNLRAYDNAK